VVIRPPAETTAAGSASTSSSEAARWVRTIAGNPDPAFGTEAKILQAIAWGVAATLDLDRSHAQALAHPDPAQGLRLAAAIQPRQYEAMYVVAVYQEAARTDPDLTTSATNRERVLIGI
jgi:hypothetical protein